jgi:hypothetical protein
MLELAVEEAVVVREPGTVVLQLLANRIEKIVDPFIRADDRRGRAVHLNKRGKYFQGQQIHGLPLLFSVA